MMARLSQEQWMSQNLGSAAQRAQTDLSPLEPADFGRAQYSSSPAFSSSSSSSSPSFSFCYSYSYSYYFSYFCCSCYYELLLIVIDKLLCLLL